VFPQGITLGVAHGTSADSSGNVTKNYPFLINIEALQRQGRFRVKSRTALETLDNKEASVNVGDQIPILKSTVQAGTGTARDVIQNIERVDVGIRLKLTPRVIPGGLVQMALSPTIEAIVETSSTGASALTPTIKRREVATTVTVPSGETIVIAGLTREDVSKVERKVPLLGSLPLLGMFFRSKSDSAVKTEVVIFVTPHIVTNPADARRRSEVWQRMTGMKPDEPK
jgi:general secretion pathway protein D